MQKPIEIKIYINPLKLAKLKELMPDWEKNGGKNTRPIYWAIDVAIDAKSEKPNTAKQNVSNSEYLRGVK